MYKNIIYNQERQKVAENSLQKEILKSPSRINFTFKILKFASKFSAPVLIQKLLLKQRDFVAKGAALAELRADAFCDSVALANFIDYV